MIPPRQLIQGRLIYDLWVGNGAAYPAFADALFDESPGLPGSAGSPKTLRASGQLIRHTENHRQHATNLFGFYQVSLSACVVGQVPAQRRL